MGEFTDRELTALGIVFQQHHLFLERMLILMCDGFMSVTQTVGYQNDLYREN